MSIPVAEYPYIRVTIDTRGLTPVATRAFGNVAIVGDAGGFGTATAGEPEMIGSEADARRLFADVDASGAISNDGADAGPLYHSLRDILAQSPGPSRIYAVATGDTAGGDPDYAGGLAAVAAAPVQFVSLARVTAPDALAALATHVADASSAGNKRMGVAMVNPDLAVAAGDTFAEAADDAYGDLADDEGRMILVAARVATTAGDPSSDLAAATMAAIAGYPPHVSVLLKQVRGVRVPLARQFTGSEVTQLAEAAIIPLIDPELVAGDGIFIGSGRSYNTADPGRLYVDVVRVLDDIEYRLKAGLIGVIGNVRIDRLGLQGLVGRIDAILGPLVASRVLDGYTVDVPLLPILETEEADRSPGSAQTLTNARTSRIVEILLTVTYAGAIHFLDINLALRA
ncbi:hypothetical protein [Microbacterium sp. 10M-3C3]|jgi:hypothetical protein|uniref:hypothetical protein n=1 Tax=Microbacterium sp. 10M-3C3 TaxID=2483401 RepID=UPI000F63D1A3|nr:hypothetical protein [Microbacterium sp. 10M-3C3]